MTRVRLAVAAAWSHNRGKMSNGRMVRWDSDAC
jgi:hypothetical protein